jgi:hypothetical protein
MYHRSHPWLLCLFVCSPQQWLLLFISFFSAHYLSLLCSEQGTQCEQLFPRLPIPTITHSASHNRLHSQPKRGGCIFCPLVITLSLKKHTMSPGSSFLNGKLSQTSTIPTTTYTTSQDWAFLQITRDQCHFVLERILYRTNLVPILWCVPITS